MHGEIWLFYEKHEPAKPATPAIEAENAEEEEKGNRRTKVRRCEGWLVGTTANALKRSEQTWNTHNAKTLLEAP